MQLVAQDVYKTVIDGLAEVYSCLVTLLEPLMVFTQLVGEIRLSKCILLLYYANVYSSNATVNTLTLSTESSTNVL